MDSIHRIGFFILFLLGCQAVTGQEDCKVIKPELAGTYIGKCKDGLANGKGSATGTDRYEGQFLKGLPHGKGTYMWATGEIYRGQWKEGKRNGQGEYTFFYNGKDSTITGFWEEDHYTGPKQEKPEIILQLNLERYNFRKTSTARNRVLINLFQNGNRNPGISNFMISASSGYETRLGQSVGYDEVTFPVNILVKYTTWNKLRTKTFLVEFEFRIADSGDWIVDMYN